MRTLCTIGHTKKGLRTFIELLRGAGVTKVIDVRLRNTSQLAGFAKKDDLQFILELCGIEYEHVVELAPTDELLDEYRASKDWERFAGGFRRLLSERKPIGRLEAAADGHGCVCLLCSEDSAEHCHRRLVAEYAKRRSSGIEVLHLG